MRPQSSSVLSVMVEVSPGTGHLKCPRSKRLKCNQNPLSSQVRILRRLRWWLQNTKSALSNGSTSKLFSTIATRPLMDFRMSVFPQAKNTGVLSLTFSIVAPALITQPTEVPYPYFLPPLNTELSSLQKQRGVLCLRLYRNRSPTLSHLSICLIFITAQPFVKCAYSNFMLFTPFVFRHSAAFILI